MIQTRKLFVVATLVAASMAMAAKDGTITLRKTLKQGVESYHMESSGKQVVTVPGGGDQEIGSTSASTYSYKIGAVDATGGSAPVEVTTKVTKFDMDGPMAEMMAAQKDKLLISTTTTGKLDARNRFTADTKNKINPLTVMAGNSSYSFIGPYLEFPEKAISIGDSWDVTIPKSPIMSNSDQKLTAKLVSEKDLDGKAVYVVALTGSLKMNINIGELMKANPVPEMEALGATDMTMSGSLDVDGEASIDKATGQTIVMTLKITSKSETNINVQGQQLSIPGTGTAKMKFSLDK